MMLPKSELFEGVLKLTTGRRWVYEVGLIVTVFGLALLGIAFVGFTTSAIARAVIGSDLERDALYGAVIMPSVLGYIFVAAEARREYHAEDTYRQAFWAGARKGAKRGFLVALAVIVFWHFIGQVLMARAIYGVLEWHKETGFYLGPRPVYYGIMWGIPVALASGALNGYIAISAQVWYDFVTRRNRSNGNLPKRAQG